MKKAAIITIFAILPMLVLAPIHVSGAAPDRTLAARAAIHPVATQAEMQGWLKRVPQTRDYPPDFDATLKGQGTAFVIEMSTTPGCVPCGDLWSRLLALKSRYGLTVRTIGEPEAMLRSGRLGLPWIGHPILWLRPVSDSGRTLPMAIGTDHAVNIARNLYLGIKMQTGVRPAVGVRAMAKFTGIVGLPAQSALSHRRKG
ncbi:MULTISPECIES: hypothetical protein [Sphingobium]|jgi:hypothetical protein|uniref:hypothetical protein n=1 Tax=Sphingobium TaxID=165695 RepID=UPI000C66AC3A|nr:MULTISPECIES: hypothetical protein [Sphingobium]MBS51121.1 hypothetical protein [Sphingobium sp.]MCC4256129.1 hypothetical protein [Sphingobium lactosutens]|tara:strand:- start:8585 stop:9184 length:600 start_codon:yes stop_codon:yes gene_type:complete